MKYLLSLIISGALVVSGFGQTRNVLVGTNNAVVQPTNFWSADASNARSGLGLGSAATNPATAFQPSSLVLSNLASSNGVNLTNLISTNIVGVLSIAQGGTGENNASDARNSLGLGSAATNPASAFQPSSVMLSNLTLSNAGNLTNITSANIVGALSINQGGTGSTNASNARTALGLDTAATNPASAFQPSSAVLSNLAAGSGIAITNIAASNIVGAVAVVNGGTGATNAATARTNLGLTWNALTNSNSTSFFNSILNTVDESSNIRIPSTTLISAGSSYSGIDPTNYDNVVALKYVSTDDDGTGGIPPDHDTWSVTSPSKFRSAIQIPLAALTNTNVSNFRSAIGIPLPALTNTNNVNFLASFFGANTNPVLVNTNGDVVSPTNFWQVAPIVTRFVEFAPSTNATTNITAARNLHIHSLALAITGVTSTIALPTTNSFNGDIALVVHQGPTSSVTAVRTAGAGTNLVTLNQFDEAVEFVYYNNVWQFNHNRSFIEPIYFSGTNAAANAAASRENLGLGIYSNVSFGEINLTGTNGITFDESDAVIATRNNLELGAGNNVSFSNVTASGTLTATSTVTAKTNLVVEGFVDYTAARTNNTPTNTPNFAAHAAWIEVKVGTNSFFLPAYQ